MRDVIIIGGGVAGLSLAAALARDGHRPLLVEQGHLPRHRVCGEFLSPDALCSLERLGLSGAVAALQPWPVTQAHLVARSGSTLSIPLPGLAWGLSRYHLDRALAGAAAAAGAEVRYGAAVRQVEPRAGGGFAVRVGDEEVETWTLVGAWGRQTLPGLRARPRPAHRRGWLGIKRHYAGVELCTAVELFLLPGGYVGLVGIGEGRVNCTALVSLPAFRRGGGGVERFFDWAMSQNRGLARRLKGARAVSGSELTISGVDTEHPPQPWVHLPVPGGSSAVMPPVALLGDAASVIPPLSGDGMAMALRSAELLRPLLWAHLAGQLSPYEMVEAYDLLYRQAFSHRLVTARWLQAGLVHPVAGELMLRLGRRLPKLSELALLATRGPAAPGRAGRSSSPGA